MVKFDFKILKNCRVISIFSFILLVLFLIGCSQNQDNAGQDDITGSAIEEPSENCRFSDQSDCSSIEITRVEPAKEEKISDEISIAESINITDKLEENTTIQNITNLALACEAGWKCVERGYIAYQEANCSWHSLERCIHGCNENESICRTGPICKIKSLKCENDNLMICGEDGYKWLLNKSCDKDCENNICTEDLPVNATQNDFISDNCISVLNFNYAPAGNNLSQEYFTLKNSCSYSIDMGGWTAKDNATTSHIFTFSSFNLNINAEVSVHTGDGTNTSTDLYWGRGSAVWNNDGDTLYLNTSNGTSLLVCPYPNNGSILNCPDL